MRAGAVTLAVCVIGACGGSSASVGDSDAGGASSSSSSGGATSSSSSGSGGSSGDVPVDGGSATDARAKDAAREANAPGCPAQFSETAPAGNCTIGLTCAYDEGTCKCVDYCGGAPPPPNEDFSHWTCEKYRTDGCPDPRPMAGSKCTQAGKACDYADCCIEQLVCTGGKWTSGGLVCPP